MSTFEMDGIILSITPYDFKGEDGQQIKGSSVMIGQLPDTESRVKGYQVSTYSSSYDFYTDISPEVLLKRVTIIGSLIKGTKGQLKFKPSGVKK